jgi:hypothetical protein
MSHVHQSVLQLAKMLRNLDRWLDKAVEQAKQKGYDPANLLQARLAPDMFTLSRQIQSVCDGVKFTAARLGGKDAPKHPDGELGLDELRARIRSVLDFVGGFKEADFAGAEERVIPLGFMPGKGLIGSDYLHQMNLPNTYFHLAMAYAILRHNGVDVGKMDFLGDANLRDL